MPRTTENFNLIYASEGEILTPDIEENRYLTIDRQMLGIFEVFGNGVIDGWNIASGSGLSIVISIGKAIIGLKYVETNVAFSLVNLMPNSTLYILAQKAESTQDDVAVVFSTSLKDSVDDETIIIGRVVTGFTSIISIDTGPRNNIDFLQSAIDLVKNHRHYGGDSPSQIDLSREVMGKLSSENIGDIDASKISGGRLSSSVMPQLNHGDLQDVGTLTHAQIDSFIRMLTYENSHLLGEVASVNLMQLFLSHKHLWSNVDEYSGNMLLFIPGISPDSYSDVGATTASIDKEEHVIKGVLSKSGSIINKTYSSNSDFNNYFYSQNIKISEGKIKIAKSPEETKVIVDFENSSQDDEEVPGFIKNIGVVSDSGGFKSTTSDKESGFYGGKITASQVVSLSYSKTYDSVQDWSDYSSLSVAVKSTDLEHAQINIYWTYLDSFGEEIEESPIILLSQNEVTDGFKNVTVDLSSYNVDKVKKIIIYTDTSLGWNVSGNFSILFDNITLKKDSLFYEQANIRYRISSPVSAQWDSISYSYLSNDGEVKIRARSSSSPSSLSLTPFSAFIGESGDSPEVENNTDFEVDIILNANNDKSKSPEIDILKISYIVPSSDNGFIIDGLDDWDNGTYSSKVDIQSSPGSVRIKEPISVGNIFYGNSIIISELDTNNIPVFGRRGNSAPPVPSKIANNELNSGFDLIYGLNRLPGGNYLFCDAGNDRILEIDPDGNFLFGIGTYNGVSEDLTVLSSVYRSSVGYLTIVLSKPVFISNIILSKFEMVTDSETVILGSSDKIIEDSLVSSSGTASVFNILLSSSNNSFAKSSGSLKLIIKDGAFQEDISNNYNISKSLQTGGIDIFIGEFIYTNNINAPVDVKLLDNGHYLIANSKKWGRQNSGVSSVVEIDKNGVSSFSFDQDLFIFTLETGGSIREYNDDFFIFSGIVGTPSNVSPDDLEIKQIKIHAGDENINQFTINVGTKFQLVASAYDSEDNIVFGDRSYWYSNNSSVISVDRFGLCTARGEGTAIVFVEIDGVEGQSIFNVVTENKNPSISDVNFSNTEEDIVSFAVGKTILVNRTNKKVQFEYVSSDGLFPSYVDMDSNGLFVISEKSLVKDKNSRVIKIDIDGNVLFDFGYGQIDSPNCVRALMSDGIIISS